jgi:hypothetical protein
LDDVGTISIGFVNTVVDTLLLLLLLLLLVGTRDENNNDDVVVDADETIVR